MTLLWREMYTVQAKSRLWKCSTSLFDLWVECCCWGVADVVQVEEGCP
jgi:hypothetical protein